MLSGLNRSKMPNNATTDYNSATCTYDNVCSTLLSGVDRSALSNTPTNDSTSNLSSSPNYRCSKMLSR